MDTDDNTKELKINYQNYVNTCKDEPKDDSHFCEATFAVMGNNAHR